MAEVETISLRDLASRLAQLRAAKDKVDAGQVLSLLKSGQIKAGFRLPTRGGLWIAIPVDYWAGVSSDKFRRIKNTKDPRSGAYKVRPGQFAKEIVAVVAELQSADEWVGVIEASARQYEVEVLVSEWEAYRSRHNLLELSPERKKKGRPEKTGWRKLCVLIGAYITKHYEATRELIKVEPASEMIHKLALDDKIADLPGSGTIKGVLSEIRHRSENLSIN